MNASVKAVLGVGRVPAQHPAPNSCLSSGVISSNQGKFNLDRFGPIDEIRLAKPAAVDPTPDYVARFPQLSPTLLWRNANVGVDFTKAGPVMAAMYKAATGDSIDGVIQIDSMGLAALLRGIGPVNTPDIGQVNGDNAVALTLNQAYTQFPDRPVR